MVAASLYPRPAMPFRRKVPPQTPQPVQLPATNHNNAPSTPDRSSQSDFRINVRCSCTEQYRETQKPAHGRRFQQSRQPLSPAHPPLPSTTSEQLRLRRIEWPGAPLPPSTTASSALGIFDPFDPHSIPAEHHALVLNSSDTTYPAALEITCSCSEGEGRKCDVGVAEPKL